MTTIEVIQIIISAATLIGLVVATYRHFSDPDHKSSTDIKVLEESCKIKHQNIDEVIGEIKDDLKHIKRNHLEHMERDLNEMKGSITAINATNSAILSILKRS